MASTPKQSDSSTPNNNSGLGKRKKSRGSKGSYLSKWLDKTMLHIQEATPSSMDTYETYLPTVTWPNSSQFAPGCMPYGYGYCSGEPTSLPTYFNPPMYGPECRYVPAVNQSVQVQRPRARTREKAEDAQSETPNGTLNSNYQPKSVADSQDYASLPPVITSVADTNSTNEQNNNAGNRRYSDPCLQGLPDVARPGNGDMDTESDLSSDWSGSQMGTKLLTCLLDQIKALKLANERLNKDLYETKAELEHVKHHISIHKGPVNMGGPANRSPLHGNGMISQYSPGMVTDMVREIRDAARVREEAVYARVRAMMLERNEMIYTYIFTYTTPITDLSKTSVTSSDMKFTEKSLEEIKSSLRASETDRLRMMDRIGKLEDELRNLRLTNGPELNETKVTNGNIEDDERVRLRKELLDARRARQTAEEHALKLEKLVTQLRSKFNGLQVTNGPESLPSDAEHESNVRARRTSVNSSSNSTVVFGPVTDL